MQGCDTGGRAAVIDLYGIELRAVLLEVDGCCTVIHTVLHEGPSVAGTAPRLRIPFHPEGLRISLKKAIDQPVTCGDSPHSDDSRRFCVNP
jgi:hypothetical protein